MAARYTLKKYPKAKTVSELGRKYLSKSYLQRVKSMLLGQPLLSEIEGMEVHLKFGGEFHKRCLEPLRPCKLMSDEQEEHLDRMVEAIEDNPTFWDIYRSAKNRIIEQENIRGDWGGIIDLRKNKVGIDLKSTSCTSENQFVKSCSKYGYFGEGGLYMKIANLDSFFLIAAMKKPPYKTFTIDVADYPLEMAEGLEELEALTYLVKHYELVEL